MKNKFLSILVCIFVIFGIMSSTVMASEDDKGISVAFYVGDEYITVNGNDIKAEPSYVVEPGITMIPARIIAETLGAEVTYNDDEICIYNDEVEILFFVDSTMVEVNGYAEMLPCAPEIKNNTLMVPLRFFAETLGADVIFDAESGEITISAGITDNGDTVKGGIESLYIGDSEYNWSMIYPNGFDVYDYDDRKNVFIESESMGLVIEISEIDEDFDINSEYLIKKYSAYGSTLTNSYIDTSDPQKQLFVVEFEDSYANTKYKVIASDKYVYNVSALCYNDTQDAAHIAKSCIDSFDLVYNKEETHDIKDNKNIVEGYKKFSDEDLNISFEIPGRMSDDSEKITKNQIYINSEDEKDISAISLSVFSKNEDLSAKSFCENKLNVIKKYAVQDTFCSEQAEEVEYKNIKGYECNTSFKYGKTTVSHRGFYFEVGDYVYEFAIALTSSHYDLDKTFDYVLNSLNAEEIPADELGNVILNMNFDEGSYTINGRTWKLTAPYGFMLAYDYVDYLFFTVYDGIATVEFEMNYDEDVTFSNHLKESKENFKEMSKEDNFKVIKAPTRVLYNGVNYVEYIYQITSDSGLVSVYRNLSFVKNEHIYNFMLSSSSKYSSEVLQEEFMEFVNSFKIVKLKK